MSKSFLYQTLQLLNKNIPCFPIAYYNYFFLEFNNLPRKQKIRFDGTITITRATLNDMNDLAQFLKKKAEKFYKRIKQGHIILIARDVNGQIVGYETLDLTSEHFEAHSGIKIKIPPDSIYLYDAYILPEYRFKGVWIGFKNAVSDIMAEEKRSRLFTFIDYENKVSIKSHLQFGFKIYENKKIWKIFGKPFCFTTPMQQDLKLIRKILKN